MARPYRCTRIATPPYERILARVDHSDPNACWIWPGATCATKGGKYPGYGVVRVGSRQEGNRHTERTHIVTWETVNGPVPDGLELDHTCRHTLCCNPSHCEAVTHQTNMDRKPAELVEKQVRSMLAARGVAW